MTGNFFEVLIFKRLVLQFSYVTTPFMVFSVTYTICKGLELDA